MAIKPASGIVRIVDKATRPLTSIANAMNSLSGKTKTTNRDVSNFQKGLNLASQRVNFLNRSMANGKRQAAGYARGLLKIASFGGLLSGAGIVTAINSQAESLDKLGKKAGNLKIATLQLQALREQAQHAGMSSDELDSSMTRFTKRLGTFQATGSGLMAGVLKKISPALAMQLKGAKNNQEAYEMLLKTYAKLPTQQAKMALADAAFGQSGRKQLLMLDEGIEGLIKSREKLISIGGFAREEDIQAAAAYNDELQDMTAAINGIKFRALTPIIQRITKLMTNFIDKFKNADYREKTIQRVTEVISSLGDGLMSLVHIATFVQSNFNEVIFALAGAKVAMFALNAVMAASPIGLIASAIGAVVVALGYAYTEFEGFRNLIDSIFETIKKIVSAIASFGGGVFDSISNLFGGDTPEIKQQVQALGNTNNNTANITVNVADGKVKSIENQGNFKANAFLNNGVQN
jgi:hypothetical protein